ncbi:MAG: leucine-rich repeat domain-containing protein, partial [Eubacterium sp.]
MKKAISLLLSVVMLLSITAGFDLSAYAKVSGDFEYAVLDDGTAEITDYSGTDKSLTIPSTIKGYSVTSIKEWSFSDSKLTKVTIPDSVTKIGDYAFYNSVSLKNVIFGNSLKNIGESAFKSCISIENLVLPNSVTTIGISAFDGCKNIETIEIGSSLKTISGLNDGFATLPHGMMQNYKLKSITVDKNNKYFSSVDGVLFNKDASKLLLYPDNKSTTTYYVPTTVKKIEKNAFINTTKLNNVVIPKSVENIDNAF